MRIWSETRKHVKIEEQEVKRIKIEDINLHIESKFDFLKIVHPLTRVSLYHRSATKLGLVFLSQSTEQRQRLYTLE